MDGIRRGDPFLEEKVFPRDGECATQTPFLAAASLRQTPTSPLRFARIPFFFGECEGTSFWRKRRSPHGVSSALSLTLALS